jgi:hypothetical protein
VSAASAALGHVALVKRACEWLAGTMGMHAVVPEIKTWNTRETPDVIAWKGEATHDPEAPARVVCLVAECKASRADFLADRAKPFRVDPKRGMGGLRYFVAPAGMLVAAEMPARWGLAEVGPRGVRISLRAIPFEEHNVAQETLLLVAAMRRLTHPSYRFPPIHHVRPRSQTDIRHQAAAEARMAARQREHDARVARGAA